MEKTDLLVQIQSTQMMLAQEQERRKRLEGKFQALQVIGGTYVYNCNKLAITSHFTSQAKSNDGASNKDGREAQEEISKLKMELEKVKLSGLEAIRRIENDAKERLEKADVDMKNMCLKAERFEMMYHDANDRESKIQHMLDESEDRIQVLEVWIIKTISLVDFLPRLKMIKKISKF